MTHILHTSTVHKNTSLADEGNSPYCQSAAHTLNIYKPMEISIKRLPNTDAQARDRTLNFLLTRTMLEKIKI